MSENEEQREGRIGHADIDARYPSVNCSNKLPRFVRSAEWNVSRGNAEAEKRGKFLESAQHFRSSLIELNVTLNEDDLPEDRSRGRIFQWNRRR